MEVEDNLLKPIPCDHPGCLATFTRIWKLQQHLSVHTGQKPYKCNQEECQKTFTRKSHLQRHTRQHLGQRHFRCTAEGCIGTFVSSDRLKKHLKYRHGNKEYFKARNVLLKLVERPSRSVEISRSIVTSTVKSLLLRYSCSFKECQFVATAWTQLQKHLKTHPIEYSCTYCEKKLKGSSALRRHKRTHMVQGSEWACPMDDCKLNFRTAFNLEHHIRKDHFKILEYKCNFPDCQKAFAMKESRLRHLVVHDPERKKLNINHDCRQKRRQGRKNLVIEEKLTRLFNEKKLFKSKSKIESDLSGLFSERKITHPVTIEVNLKQLFENQLFLPEK
ncbi:P43 5S RNA-binding protein-like [Cetorhinus maximus]